jgi:hypothetical protein
MGTAASHVKRKLKVGLKKGFRLQKSVVDFVEVVIILRQVESSL